MGVMLERDWANVEDGECTAEQMAADIKAVGAGRSFIATDRSQAGCETPLEGMLRFIELLLDKGFTDQEIRMMVCKVPKELLN